METYDVYSPVGEETVKPMEVAPPLESLDGKTICEVWNGVYKGNETFPALRALLKRKYPRLKVIPYTEFPSNYGGETRAEQGESAQRIAQTIKELGADAVISGNGA